MKLIWSILLATLIMVALLSCNETEKCNCGQSPEIAKLNDSLTQYFPRYDTLMMRFDETPIRDLDEFTIRFSLYSSWGWEKIYRIDTDGDAFKLTTKSYWTPTMSRDQDTLIDTFSRKLSLVEVAQIKKLIIDSCFWTLPVAVPDRFFLDGASWTLEVNNPEGNNCTNKTFHHVSVSCPDSDSLRFFYICDRIIQLDSINARHKVNSPW